MTFSDHPVFSAIGGLSRNTVPQPCLPPPLVVPKKPPASSGVSLASGKVPQAHFVRQKS
jgi:hypothetical protein